MPTAPNTTKRDFIFHVAFLLFVATYFAALLRWFGGLFAAGDGAAHATMAIVLPVVVVIGVVALVTLSTIAWDGRRAQLGASHEGSDPAGTASDPPASSQG